MTHDSYPPYPRLPRWTVAGMVARQRRGLVLVSAAAALGLAGWLWTDSVALLAIVSGLFTPALAMVAAQERAWLYAQVWPHYRALLDALPEPLPEQASAAPDAALRAMPWRAREAYVAQTSAFDLWSLWVGYTLSGWFMAGLAVVMVALMVASFLSA